MRAQSRSLATVSPPSGCAQTQSEPVEASGSSAVSRAQQAREWRVRGQRMSQPQPCPPGADPGGDWWTRPATSTNVSSIWNPQETMLPRALQRPGPCPCPSPHTPGPEWVRNCLGMGLRVPRAPPLQNPVGKGETLGGCPHPLPEASPKLGPS